MSDTLQPFGRYLKSLRRHETYTRLGQRAGIDVADIKAFEGGTQKPDETQLEALCVALDIKDARKLSRLRELYGAFSGPTSPVAVQVPDKYDVLRRIIKAGNELHGFQWSEIMERMQLPELTLHIIRPYIAGAYEHDDRCGKKFSHEQIDEAFARAYGVQGITSEEARRLEQQLAQLQAQKEEFRPVLRKVLSLAPHRREYIAQKVGVNPEFLGKAARKFPLTIKTYLRIKEVVDAEIDSIPELEVLKTRTVNRGDYHERKTEVRPSNVLSSDGLVQITQSLCGLIEVVLDHVRTLQPEVRDVYRAAVRDRIGKKDLMNFISGIDTLLLYGEKEWTGYVGPLSVGRDKK